MKKCLLLLTCALLLCTCVLLASCNNEHKDGEQTTAGTPSGTPGDGTSLTIAAGGVSEYKIITPQGASDDINAAAVALRNAIEQACGVKLEWTDDYVKRGESIPTDAKEILIGATNRDLSATAAKNIDKIRDYAVLENNNQIAILAGNEATLKDAVAGFAARYISGNTVTVPRKEIYVCRANYAVDSLILQGKPINEFCLYATDSAGNKNAKLFQTLIEEKVGYRIELVKRVDSGKPAIRFCNSNDSAVSAFSKKVGMFDAGWRMTDFDLVFAAGAVADVAETINHFGTLYLSGTEKSVTLSSGTEKLYSTNTNSMFEADSSFFDGIQQKADVIKNGVIASVTDVSGRTGTVYYVSNNGDDAAAGTSPETAWKTIEQINLTALRPGDAVLFERGGEWRGDIIRSDGQYGYLSGVLFGNYGDVNDPLPILNGSDRNYADSAIWVETDVPNVWRLTLPLYNVGVMVFDHSGQLGDYNAKYGKILFHDPRDSDYYAKRDYQPLDYRDLKDDLQFYSDLNGEGTLYLYSAEGNPGERFSSIEIGVDEVMLNIGGDGNSVDGIHFRFCGGFGIAGGISSNTTVRNCIMEWIGGAVHTSNKEMLYGNAIQIYGQAKNLTVENNWIYQIYDTGITFQISKNGDGNCYYENINIRNNLVEYCHWGIEFYNQAKDNTRRSTKNVLVEGNIVRTGGMGWGSAWRFECYNANTVKEASAALLCSWGFTDDTENFVIRNNIFDRCNGALGLVTMPDDKGDRAIVYEGNVYVQEIDKSFGKLFSQYYNMNLSTWKTLTEVLLDQSGTLVFTEATAD